MDINEARKLTQPELKQEINTRVEKLCSMTGMSREDSVNFVKEIVSLGAVVGERKYAHKRPAM